MNDSIWVMIIVLGLCLVTLWYAVVPKTIRTSTKTYVVSPQGEQALVDILDRLRRLRSRQND